MNARMFGALRFCLAFSVVISHLVATPAVNHYGYYAVRAFFILSGYSITRALNEVYDFDIARFWTNRLLRLVPGYLLVCVATAAAISLFPAEAGHYMPRWGFHPSAENVFENLLIVPLAFGNMDFRFIEPAWSIAVELVVYLYLFFGISRSEKVAEICFVVAALYHLVLFAFDAPFAERYFSFASAMLSFSLGALLHFWLRRGVRFAAASWVAPVSAAALLNLVGAGTLMPDDYAEGAGYYVSIALSLVLVASLAQVKSGPKMRRVDVLLGNLSYPVFLLQWLGGFIGHMIVSPEIYRGWVMLVIGTPFILACAGALAWIQVALVEPMRTRVRDREFDPETRDAPAQLSQPL